jgi:hypothetical protein
MLELKPTCGLIAKLHLVVAVAGALMAALFVGCGSSSGTSGAPSGPSTHLVAKTPQAVDEVQWKGLDTGYYGTGLPGGKHKEGESR